MSQSKKSFLHIWFWQRIVTPHMMGLAVSVARTGCRVTYVAEQPLSAERVALGWQVPGHEGVQLCFAPDDESARSLIYSADPRSVHICQGLRGNGRVAHAQHCIAQRGLQQWIVMETVDDAGVTGLLKRLIYTSLFRARWRRLAGVLATGYRTRDWVVARGVAMAHVFPFAYFLPEPERKAAATPEPVARNFRFIYVGQFVKRKRFDLLVRALSTLADIRFELWVVGSGPLEESLRTQACTALPGRVRWIGRSPSSEVRDLMAETDCLVLPSRYDGWGAVVSEALMAGTPAICSDACGSAGVVHASGVGGVFPVGDPKALGVLLRSALENGVVEPSRRAAIASWGRALGGDAGAQYLLQVIGGGSPPLPWDKAGVKAAEVEA